MAAYYFDTSALFRKVRMREITQVDAVRATANARSQGVPATAAMVLAGATSTYDEAVELRRLARQHDWHTLIVITDLFHTRRAGRTFRALLPDVTIYLSAAPNPDYDAGR